MNQILKEYEKNLNVTVLLPSVIENENQCLIGFSASLIHAYWLIIKFLLVKNYKSSNNDTNHMKFKKSLAFLIPKVLSTF